MNERIRALRKALNLTMEQFGKRIGVSKSTISNIENGNRDATEHMIKSICREFGADYIWLTTGESEMFVESNDAFYKRIHHIMASENETHKNLLITLLYATDEDIESLARSIELFANSKKKD